MVSSLVGRTLLVSVSLISVVGTVPVDGCPVDLGTYEEYGTSRGLKIPLNTNTINVHVLEYVHVHVY